jgi:ubiquinone/menaquinone biosynthesis C-methylase UbiE
MDFQRLQQSAKRVRLYDRPELYDLAYPGSPWDATFYRRLAGPGSALYLGVGTGRVFAQLADTNQRLVGLDYSRAMLAAFAKRHPRLTNRVQRGNVLDQNHFQPQSFDRILAPHSFFTQFSEGDLPKALANCRRWLKPGGRLVTDNFSPFLNPPLSRRLELFRQRQGNEGDIVTYLEYEPVYQVVREWNFFERPASRDVLVAPITLRYYYPAEFARIMRSAGFARVQVQGGFAGQSVSLESSELVYIARR